MAKQKSINIAKGLFVVLLPLIIFKCASQLPPGGGEIDKIPPEILEVYPAIGTTNFNDNYFELTFSEYVDKRSVQDAIFISPAIDGKLEYDWSGKSLEISFPDTLRENTTYTITIGTDVIDVHNRNRMAQSFNLVFSTGPEIDNGQIRGTVYDKEPDGVMVYAYRLSDSLFNPAKNKPGYVSQVGENGIYKLLGLSNGDYRVLAVRDEYRDFIYNIEQDKFGTTYKDVTLTDDDSLFSNMNFFMAVEDTTPPHLVSAVMTDMYHLLIEFSENIDSTRLNAGNFSVVDSTLNSKIIPGYFYKGQGKANQFFLTVSDSISEGNEVYLVCENLFDKFNNRTLYEATSLSVSTKLDTLPVKMLKTDTEYPNKVVDFEKPYLSFNFDDAFHGNVITEAVKVIDANEEQIPYAVKSNDDASFKIEIAKKLKPKSDYKLLIDFNYLVDAAGNKLDSVFTINFKTINDLDFTGISGRVLQNEDSLKAVVVLTHTEQKEKIYIQPVGKNNTFDFKKIIPGKYVAWSFIDENNNEKYDHGSVTPFLNSERFIFYPDTINARARWPVGDVYIEFQ